VFPVKYVGFYILKYGILHSHRLKTWLCNGNGMSPVRYELDFISHNKAFFIVTAVKTGLCNGDVMCLL
jgi:hypothetical protein